MVCIECDGRCCSTYHVPVTHHDVERIRDGLQEKKPSFIDFIPVNEMSSEYPDVRLDSGYYYMTLKRDDAGNCLFLKDNTCSIHTFKPTLCRIYPYGIIDGKLTHRRIHKCPKTWNPTGKEKRRLQADLRMRGIELDSYSELVLGWNRGGLKDSYLFSRKIMRNKD